MNAFLAGLQAGMVGVLWMLAWMGMSAVLQRRTFWTAENLFASAFYGGDAIRAGFSATTLSGLALYLLIYSVLGGIFAWVFHNRLPRVTLTLAAMAFAVIWYYLTFRLLWRSLLPLVALLHSGFATLLGHVLYGSLLGRFPAYVPQPAATAESALPQQLRDVVPLAASEFPSETQEG